jgi:heat shock protein HslJ
MLRSSFPTVMVLGLALAGCAARGTGSHAPGNLVGTAWRLVDLGGAAVLGSVDATLEFPEAGKVAGSGSCNRFSGSVETSGETIRVGNLASTRMACVEAVMSQEERYFGALQGAERVTLDGATLFIRTRGMEKPLRFVRKSP